MYSPSHTDAINNFDNPLNDSNCILDGKITPKLPLCTGGIFATYPAPYLSLANGFLDQVREYYYFGLIHCGVNYQNICFFEIHQ